MSNSKGTKWQCSVCGFRKRGSNHDNGQHHKLAAYENKYTTTGEKGKAVIAARQ